MTAPSWAEFEQRQDARPTDEARAEFATICASLFTSGNGATFIKWLRTVTKERTLGPESSHRALAYLEGQRHLCAQIEALIDEGAKPRPAQTK